MQSTGHSQQVYQPPTAPALSISLLQNALSTAVVPPPSQQFSSLCSNIPTMPGKFANAAAIGEFVEFSELLHVIDTGKGGEEPPVQIELTEGHHLALSKRPKQKGISSFPEWVSCFCMYANTYCAHNPHRATDMIGYLFIIASALREYSLTAVLAYDIAFQRKAGTVKGTPWGKIDPALYSRAFTGPGKAKPFATCAICLQAGHAQSDCPFYTDRPAKRARGMVAGPKFSAPATNNREVCRKRCVEILPAVRYLLGPRMCRTPCILSLPPQGSFPTEAIVPPLLILLPLFFLLLPQPLL